MTGDCRDGLIRILDRKPEGIKLRSGLEVLVENMVLHMEQFDSSSMTKDHEMLFSDLKALNLDIARGYYILITKLHGYSAEVRNQLAEFEAMNPKSGIAIKTMGADIRQVEIRMHDSPPEQRFQMLYFNIPPSCRNLKRSKLITSFFREMWPDTYLEVTWRQR